MKELAEVGGQGTSAAVSAAIALLGAVFVFKMPETLDKVSTPDEDPGQGDSIEWVESRTFDHLCRTGSVVRESLFKSRFFQPLPDLLSDVDPDVYAPVSLDPKGQEQEPDSSGAETKI